MRLPRQFWAVSPEGVQPSVRTRVQSLLTKTTKMRAQGANIVIYGGVGVGKSAIASLFARSFRAHRFPTTWTSVWQLREHIREKDRFGNDEISMMERVRLVDVLVIDDLQSGNLDGWFSLSDFTNTIRSRHAQMKPTIITTRIEENELVRHPVIHALYERLLQIPVKGENLAMKKSQAFAKEFE